MESNIKEMMQLVKIKSKNEGIRLPNSIAIVGETKTVAQKLLKEIIDQEPELLERSVIFCEATNQDETIIEKIINTPSVGRIIIFIYEINGNETEIENYLFAELNVDYVIKVNGSEVFAYENEEKVKQANAIRDFFAAFDLNTK